MILLLLSITGTLLTMFFLLYDEDELHGLIIACLIMIFFLFGIRRIADKLECHRKYIEYHVLAETLRVQFFLSVAGIKKPVAEILPWFIKQSLPWIESILKTLPVPQLKEKYPILNFWIIDQRGYHSDALLKSENQKYRDNHTSHIVLIITLIAYFVTLMFEIYIYTNSAGNIDVNAVRAILKIVVGTMSAITLFTGSYYGKMSLTNTIQDHKRMIALYNQAEMDIRENGEDKELLLSLAREFLIENSTWYAYQSRNKPDLVF